MQGKERPMLLSTDMVVATLALEIINTSPDSVTLIGTLCPNWKQKDQPVFRFKCKPESLASDYLDIQCPYGKPGDILWVRETWAMEKYFNGLTEECFPIYKADYGDGPVAWNWKPSIFMKKIFARIWLEITDIRVERLHDITDEDALAEGIMRQTLEHEIDEECYYFYPCNDLRDDSYIDKPATSFTSLWASINGWQSWIANPWVWVISFKVLSKTGRPMELERKEVANA